MAIIFSLESLIYHVLGIFWLAVTLLCIWLVATTAFRLLLQVFHNLVRGKRLRDTVFHSVTPSKLRTAAAEHFQRHTPGMLELGFELIGDYRLLHHSGISHSRYFLSPDRRCLGEIFASKEARGYCLLSVFEDGHYLETTTLNRESVAVPTCQNLVDAEGIELWQLDIASVEKVHQFQRQRIAKYEEERSCSPRELTADGFEEVVNHGKRSARSLLWRSFRLDPPRTVSKPRAARA